eukprot:8390093-Pyramimonas_sp.AAC.1
MLSADATSIDEHYSIISQGAGSSDASKNSLKECKRVAQFMLSQGAGASDATPNLSWGGAIDAHNHPWIRRE